MDSHKQQVLVLERKLQSKSEALLIISQEFDNVKADRDALHVALQSLKKQIKHIGLDCSKFVDLGGEASVLKEKLNIAEERVKELESDNKCLRVQLEKLRSNSSSSQEIMSCSHLYKLENAHSKILQMEHDVQSLVDEKQELASEKDGLRNNLHRLNHYINCLMRQTDAKMPLVSIDMLVMENTYLHERVEDLTQELDVTQKLSHKYKSLLDTKRKGKNGKATNMRGLLMSVSQVRDMVLTNGPLPALPSAPGKETEIYEAEYEEVRGACRALLDSLEDKTAALAQLKKANKLLAKRIMELEKMLSGDASDGTESLAYPSKFLLKYYYPTEVDRDLASLDVDRLGEELQARDPQRFHCAKQPVEAGITLPCSTPEPGRVSTEETDLPPDLQKLVDNAKAILQYQQ